MFWIFWIFVLSLQKVQEMKKKNVLNYFMQGFGSSLLKFVLFKTILDLMGFRENWPYQAQTLFFMHFNWKTLVSAVTKTLTYHILIISKITCTFEKLSLSLIKSVFPETNYFHHNVFCLNMFLEICTKCHIRP